MWVLIKRSHKKLGSLEFVRLALSFSVTLWNWCCLLLYVRCYMYITIPVSSNARSRKTGQTKDEPSRHLRYFERDFARAVARHLTCGQMARWLPAGQSPRIKHVVAGSPYSLQLEIMASLNYWASNLCVYSPRVSNTIPFNAVCLSEWACREGAGWGLGRGGEGEVRIGEGNRGAGVQSGEGIGWVSGWEGRVGFGKGKVCLFAV